MEFILFMALRDTKPEMREKVVDGKLVEAPVRLSPRTAVKELARYEGIVKAYPWGSFNIEEVRDSGTIASLIEVLDRYDREGPLELPEPPLELTLPTAQWSDKRKNCKDLAMPIVQFFYEQKFPEFMVGRRYWKDVDPDKMNRYRVRPGIYSGSEGTMGLRNRASYYGRRS